MNNNPYSAELYQWVRKRSSKKRKMVTGIVFTAIAYFLEMVGIGVYYATYDEDLYIVAAIIIIISLPFWAVGLPLLITGIVGTIKAKRQISRITAEQRRAETAQQQGYQQPMYQQPNYQQPNYQQPNYQQPNYQQPNYQQPNYQQPIYQPPMYQQQPQQPVYQPPMPEQSAPEQPADTNDGNDNAV